MKLVYLVGNNNMWKAVLRNYVDGYSIVCDETSFYQAKLCSLRIADQHNALIVGAFTEEVDELLLGLANQHLFKDQLVQFDYNPYTHFLDNVRSQVENFRQGYIHSQINKYLIKPLHLAANDFNSCVAEDSKSFNQRFSPIKVLNSVTGQSFVTAHEALKLAFKLPGASYCVSEQIFNARIGSQHLKMWNFSQSTLNSLDVLDSLLSTKDKTIVQVLREHYHLPDTDPNLVIALASRMMAYGLTSQAARSIIAAPLQSN